MRLAFWRREHEIGGRALRALERIEKQLQASREKRDRLNREAERVANVFDVDPSDVLVLHHGPVFITTNNGVWRYESVDEAIAYRLAVYIDGRHEQTPRP